jgi:hypothetical protein
MPQKTIEMQDMGKHEEQDEGNGPAELGRFELPPFFEKSQDPEQEEDQAGFQAELSRETRAGGGQKEQAAFAGPKEDEKNENGQADKKRVRRLDRGRVVPEDVLRDDGKNKGGVKPDPGPSRQEKPDAENEQAGQRENEIVDQEGKVFAATEDPVKKAQEARIGVRLFIVFTLTHQKFSVFDLAEIDHLSPLGGGNTLADMEINAFVVIDPVRSRRDEKGEGEGKEKKGREKEAGFPGNAFEGLDEVFQADNEQGKEHNERDFQEKGRERF